MPQPLPLRALALLAAAWPGTFANEWATKSIGERDRYLLLLREELFGFQLEATASCPKCGAMLDLTFRTEDVRVPAPPVPVAPEPLRLTADGYDVGYRVATSDDLIEITAAVANGADPRDVLLRRCMLSANLDGVPSNPATLSPSVVDAVILQMAQADQQADVRIALSCSECSHPWSIPFDIASYLWTEIEDWARHVMLEVHALASAYGWAERDILAMSARRRRRYLEFVGV